MALKISILILVCVLQLVSAQLRVGFYSRTCPQAENIVRQVVQTRFKKDRSITAALLRMHNHDCFVRGCDASILIDSTKGKPAEKDAPPNLSIRGFDIIDEVKKRLEAACPSKVSCADIITLATRYAVALAGGPSYPVPTGRRDGLVSDAAQVNLPGPQLSVTQALTFFTARGLSLHDMVTLLGGHTVGVTHCSFVQDRLFNFQGTGRPDPSMDPALVSSLSRICSANNGGDPPLFLDQNTSFVVDNKFYNEVMKKRGILQIDQNLAFDKSSAPIVRSFASNGSLFLKDFADAMIKMGKIDVLVGSAGEIRKNCRAFNHQKAEKKKKKKHSKKSKKKKSRHGRA